MDDSTDSRRYEYNMHVMQESMPIEERGNDPGASYMGQSDNEDMDPMILESEGRIILSVVVLQFL